MSIHSDKAEQLFRQGYNCSQAVFCAFSDVTGIDFEYAAKMSASFGGGFGRLREVCGAACGMTLVLGCLEGYSYPTDYSAKKELYTKEQKLMGKFSDKMGSYICREILGDIVDKPGGAPTPRTEEFYTKRPCLRCIRNTCEILDEHLSSEE